VDDEEDDEHREVYAVGDLRFGDLTDLSDLPQDLRDALSAPTPTASTLLKRSPLFRDSTPVAATKPYASPSASSHEIRETE
jgi:hypothetical protein